MKRTKVSSILGGGGRSRTSRFSIRLGQLMRKKRKENEDPKADGKKAEGGE